MGEVKVKLIFDSLILFEYHDKMYRKYTHWLKDELHKTHGARTVEN